LIAALLSILVCMVTNSAAVLFQSPIAWTAGRFPVVVVQEVVVVRHAHSINAGHGDRHGRTHLTAGASGNKRIGVPLQQVTGADAGRRFPFYPHRSRRRLPQPRLPEDAPKLRKRFYKLKARR